MPHDDQTIYDQVGGEATFKRLVDDFYARVEADPVLRVIFPDDLEPGKRWQQLFLMQYFGGPTQYAEERGHPRLRMRHSPFPINEDAKDRWLSHMLAAIDDVGIDGKPREVMRQYFVRAAIFMVNAYGVDTSDADE